MENVSPVDSLVCRRVLFWQSGFILFVEHLSTKTQRAQGVWHKRHKESNNKSHKKQWTKSNNQKKNIKWKEKLWLIVEDCIKRFRKGEKMYKWNVKAIKYLKNK